MNDTPNGRKKKLRNILVGIGVVILFAYAIQVTQINLREPLEPRRQENLQGLIRDLARQKGMRTLREDGMEKVARGITTYEEVLLKTMDAA